MLWEVGVPKRSQQPAWVPLNTRRGKPSLMGPLWGVLALLSVSSGLSCLDCLFAVSRDLQLRRGEVISNKTSKPFCQGIKSL